MPSSTKSTDYIGYLTQLYPTKVHSLTLIYRDKFTNALISLSVRARRGFKVDLKEWYKFYLNLRV